MRKVHLAAAGGGLISQLFKGDHFHIGSHEIDKLGVLLATV